MLDHLTRKRIDDLRDILVGKVPDPKSQVEQITISLIYKFMNDMDEESMSMGGVASFFINEFEKYSWKNIFNPRTTGSDLVFLYSEAVERMSQNPYIPQLFRDIFKNAFIPYKDPETLRLFLKSINDFEYTNSEKLGDAFEYLISFMGSQGDAGQFRTPRHIIDFVVDIIDPQKTESILDPASGSAGFLISAYKHILKNNTSQLPGDLLSSDERNLLTNQINGYDISPDMVRLGLANLYLHNFTNPRIFEYDSLTSEERWGEYYDVILANPPFMTPKGGIRPHQRFLIQSSKAEQLFIAYILQHLKPEGRAGIIVPEGILENINSSAIRNLRKLLVENGLFAIVSLPVGIFNPYAKSIKTSILLIDKKTKDLSNDILHFRIDNDGYDLGLTRKKIEQDDLPDALKTIKSFIKNNYVISIVSEKISILSKKKILENSQVSLNIKNYHGLDLVTRFEKKKIGEIFFLEHGSLQSNDNVPGDFIFITASAEWKTHNTYTHDCEAIVYAVGASGSLGRAHYVNGKFISSNLCYVLTPKEGMKDKINIKFYYFFFKELRDELIEDLTRGAAKKSIGKTTLSSLAIPFPPLVHQNRTVELIESNNDEIAEHKFSISEFEEKISDLKELNRQHISL